MSNVSGKGTQSTPVTVSREVAEAIKQTVDCFGNYSEIIECHVAGPNDYLEDSGQEALNGLPLDTLIRALYVGYDVEKSPEEKLADYIEEVRCSIKTGVLTYANSYAIGKYDGLREAAEILGVKLPEPTEGADAN
jgi:hypothetical protein